MHHEAGVDWSSKFSTGAMLTFFLLNPQFQPTELTLKEGRTTPPNPLTEAELIGLMDKVTLSSFT